MRGAGLKSTQQVTHRDACASRNPRTSRRPAAFVSSRWTSRPSSGWRTRTGRPGRSSSDCSFGARFDAWSSRIERAEVKKVSVVYTAGFLDGEGCIGFSMKRGAGTLYLHVDLANTNREVLRALQARWGGALCPSNRKRTAESVRRKLGYYLRLGGREAVPMLRAVYPHLIVKRRQAALAFAWAEMERFGSRGQGVRMTARMLRQRLRLKRKMHELNHRGPRNFRETRWANGFVGGIQIGRAA